MSEMLLPVIGDDETPFWEAARKGELRIQTCKSCDRMRFPPRPMCPWCNSTQSEWKLTQGRGTIWSFVVPHPPLLPQFMDLAPYLVIAVTLDEDPKIRFIGNLVERSGDAINVIDPSTIEIGQAVEVFFDPVNEEIHMPRWVRV